MDLEENGYVQKRIRFFMGLNFITLSLNKTFFMDVLVNELLMRNIQLLFLVYYVISLIEVLEFVSIQYE